MRSISLATLVALAAASLAPGAGAGGIGGLVSGVVYDEPSRSIRPVVGAPGASYLGEPMAQDLDAVWPAPDGDQALVLVGGAAGWLKGLRNGTLEWQALPALAGKPERVAWALDSSAAAVHAAGRVMLVDPTGGVSASFSTEALGGPILSLAVTGGAVLAGVDGVGLYWLNSGGPARLLARLAQPGSLVVTRSGRLLVADRAREEILEIRNWRESAEVSLFANASAGVTDPAAMAASPDGKLLLVAGSTGRKVAFFDLASGALLRWVPLDFEPTRLQPLDDGTSWLLTERRRAGDVLEVLTTAGEETAVFFIPAPAEGLAEAQE